jgi:hypothetical protein
MENISNCRRTLSGARISSASCGVIAYHPKFSPSSLHSQGLHWMMSRTYRTEWQKSDPIPAREVCPNPVMSVSSQSADKLTRQVATPSRIRRRTHIFSHTVGHPASDLCWYQYRFKHKAERCTAHCTRSQENTTVISGGVTPWTITGLYPYEMEVNKPKDVEWTCLGPSHKPSSADGDSLFGSQSQNDKEHMQTESVRVLITKQERQMLGSQPHDKKNRRWRQSVWVPIKREQGTRVHIDAIWVPVTRQNCNLVKQPIDWRTSKCSKICDIKDENGSNKREGH